MKKYQVIFAMKAAVVLCALLMVGCGGGKETSTGDRKIADWKYRESRAPMIETECVITGNVKDDIEYIINSVRGDFYYTRENVDYWKSSQEALEDGFGDCEDMAAIAYRVISDSCLVDEYGLDVRIRIIDQGEELHAIAIAYSEYAFIEVSNFYVSDHESHNPVTAEFFLF